MTQKENRGRISVTVTPETEARIKALAEELEVSVSRAADILIRRGLDAGQKQGAGR